MNYEHLFDAEYTYRTSVDVVESADDTEDERVQLFGGGDGIFRGRLAGIVEWDNAPYFRKDGIFTPNVRGLLKTDDGARVRFEGQGYSIASDDPKIRRFHKYLRFFSKSPAYAWVNEVIAFEEGVIFLDRKLCVTRAHSLVHDLGPEQALGIATSEP